MIEYRKIKLEELTSHILSTFNRYQKVSHCWRYEDQKWLLKELSFVEEWDAVEKLEVIDALKQTILDGGVLYGAFVENLLVGFSSVEGKTFGCEHQYLQLSNLHVSNEWRHQGIGRRLFLFSAQWAKLAGAKKIYISAHSSQETMAFYEAVGCEQAVEKNLDLVALEPCDCQIEYKLEEIIKDY